MSITFSQSVVTAFVIDDGSPTTKLEKKLLLNIVKLHNTTASEKIKIEFENLNVFGDLFNKINAVKKKNNALACYQITITEERKKKYEFSSKYLPIKESIYTRADNTNLDYKIKGSKISYQPNSTNEKPFKELSESYNIIGVPKGTPTAKIKALLSKEVDFVIGDNIDVWGNNKLKIVDDFKVQAGFGFGIMYPKGSTLRDKLEPSLTKYLKSQSYFNFLYKNYGKDVAKYYRKNMKF
jgi:ABC-type amino acid transport substrate-binding protein